MDNEMNKDTTCYLLINTSEEVMDEFDGDDAKSSTAYLKLRYEMKKLIEQGGNHFLIEPMDNEEWWTIQILLDLRKTFKDRELSYTVVKDNGRCYDWLNEHPEKNQFILGNARELLQTELSEYYIAKHADFFCEVELNAD